MYRQRKHTIFSTTFHKSLYIKHAELQLHSQSCLNHERRDSIVQHCYHRRCATAPPAACDILASLGLLFEPLADVIVSLVQLARGPARRSSPLDRLPAETSPEPSSPSPALAEMGTMSISSTPRALYVHKQTVSASKALGPFDHTGGVYRRASLRRRRYISDCTLQVAGTLRRRLAVDCCLVQWSCKRGYQFVRRSRRSGRPCEILFH